MAVGGEEGVAVFEGLAAVSGAESFLLRHELGFTFWVGLDGLRFCFYEICLKFLILIF